LRLSAKRTVEKLSVSVLTGGFIAHINTAYI